MLQSLVGSLLQPALSGALGAQRQAPGPLYDFRLLPTLTALGFARTGLGTRIEDDGDGGYGPHNLLQRSDEQENAYWETYGLVSSRVSSATAYDGTRSTLITYSTGTDFTFVRRIYLATAGQRYFVALRVHSSSTHRYVTLRPFQTGGTSTFPTYDLHTGTWIDGVTGVADSGLEASAESLGGGWVRLVASCVVGVTENRYASFAAGAASANVENITNPAASTLLVQRMVAGFGRGGSAADDAGLLTTTAAVFLPRIQHNPTAPHSALGVLIEPQATNEIVNGGLGGAMATQTRTVTAAQRTLSFTGTGTVTLSGVATGSLVGTGAGESNRVKLTFTPTAGSLTLTVAGTVTDAQLELGAVVTSVVPTPSSSQVRSADPIWDLTGAAFTPLWGEPTYGSELVTNGDFATNTWWIISAATPATAAIAGGKLTLLSPAGQASLSYKPILTIGKRYLVTVDVTIRSGTVKVGAGSGEAVISSTGSYVFVLVCSGDTNLYLSRNGACDADFDNISVREVINSERTIIVEWWDTGAAAYDVFVAHAAGSIAESAGIYVSGGNIKYRARAGGVDQIDLTIGTIAANGRNKCAFRFGSGAFGASRNGAAEVTGTGTIPAPTHGRISGTSLYAGAAQDILAELSFRPAAITGAANSALSAL
jgi:hypothetical protein